MHHLEHICFIAAFYTILDALTKPLALSLAKLYTMSDFLSMCVLTPALA